MWMCIKQDDEGARDADVSFGQDAKHAYEQYRSYHDNDASPEEMFFYELPTPKLAIVTWQFTLAGT